MKFLILNGPNINLARWSEPGVPGEVDYTGLMDYVQAGCDQLGIDPAHSRFRCLHRL